MIKVLVIFTCAFCNDGISNNVMNYFTYINHENIHADFLCNNKDVPQKWIDKINSFGGTLKIIENRNKKPFNYINKLIDVIKIGGYDIVHAHGNSATLATEMYAAKKAGCKIRIAHSRNTQCTHKFFDKILRPLFYANYTYGFACGIDAGNWLFKKRKFTVIKNGNDIDKFKFNLDSRNKIRKELNISENTTLITNVGILTKQKNQEFLIDIYKQLTIDNDRKYKLLIVGKGELKEKLLEKIKKYNIINDVIFLEDRNDVNEILSATDIYLFPSLYEGLPNALVEAQISCLPCLVSNTITQEANVSKTIQYLSISYDNISEWINCITKINTDLNSRINNEKVIIQNIKESGFDIKENAKCLENIYIELKERTNDK